MRRIAADSRSRLSVSMMYMPFAASFTTTPLGPDFLNRPIEEGKVAVL